MLKKYNSPLEALNELYGYPAFRDGQEDIINNVMEGRDTLALMKTGGGKSITFQMPALCLNGVTIVISPLLSLMKDQVDRLQKQGISAARLDSTLSMEENNRVLFNMINNKYHMVYMSPEKLITPAMISALSSVKVALITVDEAHCIATWGNDFRLAYKKIPLAIKQLEQNAGRRIPKLALTATATEEVQKEIVENLEMDRPFISRTTFDRDNIKFAVQKSTDKSRDIYDLINRHQGESIVIYCATIKTANSLYQDLSNKVNVGIYHGQLDKDVKAKTQEDFVSGKIKIMIATNAFGMGVDKADVRLVIHHHMPNNLENYYQEAGRAGRDGKDSTAVLLYSTKDRNLQEFFIDKSYPDADIVLSVKRAIGVAAQMQNNGIANGIVNIDYPTLATYTDNADISANDIPSCLRLLEENGLITTNNFDDRSVAPTIEIIDLDKELDVDYLNKRKKVVTDNLNIMDRYCITKMCKRTYILRHFGESCENSQCGNCSSCTESKLTLGLISEVIPDQITKKALSLLDEIKHNPISMPMFIDVLLGTERGIYSKNGLDTKSQFGMLKHWTRGEVKAFVGLLESNKLVTTRKSAIDYYDDLVLSVAGYESISKDAPVSIVIQRSSSEKSTVKSRIGQAGNGVLYDESLGDELYRLAVEIGTAKKMPYFNVLSLKTIRTIATIKPVTREGLIAVGLQQSKIAEFGDRILALTDKKAALEQNFDIPF